MYNTKASLNLPTALPSEMKTVVQIILKESPSKHTRRNYLQGMRGFLACWLEKAQPISEKFFLQTYMFDMGGNGIGEANINIRLCAIKNLPLPTKTGNSTP